MHDDFGRAKSRHARVLVTVDIHVTPNKTIGTQRGHNIEIKVKDGKDFMHSKLVIMGKVESLVTSANWTKKVMSRTTRCARLPVRKSPRCPCATSMMCGSERRAQSGSSKAEAVVRQYVCQCQ